MHREIGVAPVTESGICGARGFVCGGGVVERLKGRRRKIARDAGVFIFRYLQRAGFLDLRKFAFHLAPHLLRSQRIDENLDAGFEEIVAPAGLVVDAQYRFEEGKDVLLGDEVADDMADIGRAPHAAAGIDAIARFAAFVANDLDADIVELDRRAVMRGARYGDLEFARQEREFRMQARPLPDNFGQHARVFDLVGRRTREMVGGDVADAIAARLDRVHFDTGEIGERVGHVDQLDPVELDVLPRREMAVALVVFARDMSEHAQLARRQGAVGHRDAQHIGVQLQIEPVHQPQRLEFVFGQFAAEPAFDLVAELRDAFGDEASVEFVIPVHGRSPVYRDRFAPSARPRG